MKSGNMKLQHRIIVHRILPNSNHTFFILVGKVSPTFPVIHKQKSASRPDPKVATECAVISFAQPMMKGQTVCAIYS